MLTKEEKGQIVGDFETHDGDTGSPEVQVAILTKRINDLTGHLKNHPTGFDFWKVLHVILAHDVRRET